MSCASEWKWRLMSKTRLVIAGLGVTILALSIALILSNGKVDKKAQATSFNSFQAVRDHDDTTIQKDSPPLFMGLEKDQDWLSQLAQVRQSNINLAADVVQCPVNASSSQTFMATDLPNPAVFKIGLSTSDSLCTLVRLHNPAGDGLEENTFLQPIGRSFSGHPWEKTRGKFVQQVGFNCVAGSSCSINLNRLEAFGGGGMYQLTTFLTPSQYTPRDIMARFLEQATFGPTREDMDSLMRAAGNPTDVNSLKSSPVFAQWVRNEQNHHGISHRALYRRQLNARFEVANPVGRVTVPCEKGARFRRTAFSEKDRNKNLHISTHGSKKLFSVDGVVRTAFAPPLYGIVSGGVITDVWYPDGDYKISRVYYNQYTGLTTVQVEHPLYNYNRVTLVVKASDGFYYSNIPIEVQPGVNDVMLNIANAWAEPIDTAYSARQESLRASHLNSPEEPDFILKTDLGHDVCASLATSGAIRDECTPNESNTAGCSHSRCKPPPTGCIYVDNHFVVTESGDCCPQACFAVDGQGRPCKEAEKAVIAQWKGHLYIHDPRYHIEENTLAQPMMDGGGQVVDEFGSILGTEWTPRCANVPRTFLNEDSCFLSNEANACSYRPTQRRRSGQHPSSLFYVTLDKLRQVYFATGGGAPGTTYLYAVAGLRINDDNTATPPCQPGSRTRWVKAPCTSNPAAGLGGNTKSFLELRLAQRDGANTNPNFMDWYHSTGWNDCDAGDRLKKGFEIRNTNQEGTCFRNVHPDHMNVYDFTFWVESHPGNSPVRNPISEFHENGSAILTFPHWHEMTRFVAQKNKLRPTTMKLGENFGFYQLPQKLRTYQIAGALGVRLENTQDEVEYMSGPTMVCGSPNEIANQQHLGGSAERGAFDAASPELRTTSTAWLSSQKGLVWMISAMARKGQLRQKVAWALAQIFAITPADVRGGSHITEAFVNYYDIFVRNAFGNYRDILKEVSYSPLMSEMLTYYGGRSTAVVLEDENGIEFADENYAREVMQLFSVGLYRLNRDGTRSLNSQGVPERVYSNDDIEEYARAWTGFVRQERRGNIEEFSRINQIDPLAVVSSWRDRFPKMGLDRKYIGDGYPLCSDLPYHHWLSPGATYRLLDSSAPELHEDPIEWRGHDKSFFMLDRSSHLYARLGLSPGVPLLKYVLDRKISCFGKECTLDTLRTVGVRVGGTTYYYEYIRQPCVYEGFKNPSGLRTIAKRRRGRDPMCGDTSAAIATGCCGGDSPSWSEEYLGERIRFTAPNRCNTCNSLGTRPSCPGTQCQDDNYFWTTVGCRTKAKVDMTSGKVSIVHAPNGVAADDVASRVRQHTRTTFRVDWRDCESPTSCGTPAPCATPAACGYPNCAMHACTDTDDGKCLCDVSVLYEKVFGTPPSRRDVLDQLRIGAVRPAGQSPQQLPNVQGVWVYGSVNSFTQNTIFEVIDDYGKRVLRKNMRSTVTLSGATLAFRNPVHFISLADAEPRDLHYETEATVDHYFYHQNTAPFLAYRFAQRFGVSNPTPRFTRAIANIFTRGYHTVNGIRFGSGQYGDLAATFAALLLERGSRDFLVDTDPANGSLKEPLLKVVGLLRGLEFGKNSLFKWPEFRYDINNILAQMPHQLPSVFSFFLPEYQPSGAVSQGSLVAPEAQVLTSPRIISTLNGLFSTIKYGLNRCMEGLGPTGYPYCHQQTIGSSGGVGGLDFRPTGNATDADAVAELATVMTAGRLSPETRALVESVYSSEADPDKARVKAQLLIAATPEFHATGIVQPQGDNRPERSPPTPSVTPYKALVYVFLPGAYDSWNTLVPHTCSGNNAAGRNPRQQYEYERTTMSLSDAERTRIIDASDQPCSQFAVHPSMEYLQRNYNAGDLSFFVNVGQLDQPVTKADYARRSTSQLFAHNAMQQVAQGVDPWDVAPGTGVLGRMVDALRAKGSKAQAITIQDATVATVGVPGASVDPLVLGLYGVTKFAPALSSDGIDMNDYWRHLTNKTNTQSNVFGETWSEKLKMAVEDSEQLNEAFQSVALTQNFPNDGASIRMKAVARTILTAQDRGVDRDVIFVRVGGWDHHNYMKTNLQNQLTQLNTGLSVFESELKAQGLWDSVTTVVVSEFARTLTANSGDGSDHAWGGHYFMAGGEVDGGKIHGAYPPDISETGPLNIGRGRIIPTSPWESMLTSVVQHMGLTTDAELDYCLPNRHRTGGQMISADQVFTSRRRSLRGENGTVAGE